MSTTQGVTKDTSVKYGEGITPVESISTVDKDPNVFISTTVFGECTYTDPGTACIAQSIHEATVTNLSGAITYSWTILSGNATIVGLNTDQTVTVESTSGVDETFVLEISINTGLVVATRTYNHLHTDITIPPAPAALAANATSTTSIDLTWVDNSTIEDGYTIMRSITGLPADFTTIATLPSGSTSYSDIGLLANTVYFYSVEAFNTYGVSANTEDSATTGELGPSTLLVQAGNLNEIQMAWTLNSIEETSVEIERSLDGTTGWSTVASLAPSTIFYRDIGLTELTEYFYRIRVITLGSPSDYSNIGSAIVVANLPLAPTLLVATTVSESSISTVWVDNAYNEFQYRVEKSLDGSTNWIDIAGPLSANVETYTETGLTPGTEYWYRSYCVNTSGNSPYSNVDSSITNGDVPFAPTGLSFIQVGDLQFDLTWVDNSAIEDNYIVERSEDLGSIWSAIATLPANTTAYTDTVTTNFIAYQYRVYAQNLIGDSNFSNIVTTYAGYDSMLQDKQGNPLEDKVGGFLLDKTGI